MIGSIDAQGRELVDVGDSGSTLATGMVDVTDSAAVQIRPATPSRIALAVTNTDAANAVYLGPASTVTDLAGAHPGMYLAAGATISLTSTSTLYARCATGDSATLTWMEETP